MKPLQGRALIGQSGGPTAVINQSLVGLIQASLESPDITQVLGAENGIQGILDERLVDLEGEDRDELERVACTPAAALGSVRKKPTAADCERALDVIEAHDVRYVFYIGGNDSAETAHILSGAAQARDFELRVFHVPKTIDNDLAACDHTPGFGSAARFVAQAFMGDDADNRSLGGVKINVVMGRHAGWLTAASRLARRDPSDGPHLIYLPERTFERAAFAQDVSRCMQDHGRCLVAVSEGIHLADGTYVAQAGAGSDAERDSHGNIQLSGSGALGDRLSAWVKQDVPGATRVRADTFGYLQRSYFGVVSQQDADEARAVGRFAVEVATGGEHPHGSISIQRDMSSGVYRPRLEVVELGAVAQLTRVVPDEFILGQNDVAEAFLEYAAPLAGDLPRAGRLSLRRIPKRSKG